MQQHYSATQEGDYNSSDNFYQPQGTQPGAQTVARNNNGPAASQRLALAISSLITLILICVVVMGFLTNGGHTVLSWSGLVLACVLIVTLSVAITAINFIFNYRQQDRE